MAPPLAIALQAFWYLRDGMCQSTVPVEVQCFFALTVRTYVLVRTIQLQLYLFGSFTLKKIRSSTWQPHNQSN
jgi:hypothetical protein